MLSSCTLGRVQRDCQSKWLLICHWPKLSNLPHFTTGEARKYNLPSREAICMVKTSIIMEEGGKYLGGQLAVSAAVHLT